MFKLKEELYIEQLITIDDFKNLIVLGLSWEDLEIEKNGDKAKVFTKILSRENKSEQADSLELVLLKAAIETPLKFPAAYHKSGERQQMSHTGYRDCFQYKVKDLIDFVINKYGEFPFNIPEWAEAYIESSSQKEEATKTPEGFVKLDNLPRILKLIVEVCNESDPVYDTKHPDYDEEYAIGKLENLAKTRNIYFGNNQRTERGLGKINAQKIIQFIQKDRN